MKYLFSLFFSILLTTLVAQTDMDTLKVNYEANGISLSEVFTELEAKYGIRFSYATSAILDQSVEVSFEDRSIGYVLDYLLRDIDMEYKILSNNILVRKSDQYKEAQNETYKKGFHLKGRVVQPNQSTEGIEMATIAISNTTIGTYTDNQGRFDIEIPSEYISEQLVIHALGFQDQTYTITELKGNFLMATLEGGGFSISEVTIVNRKKPLKVDQIKNSIGLHKNQLNNITSGIVGSDLSRQLQLLPGISSHDDTSAEIKIRGSNSDETMIILDGMPIYHTSHYFGIFSGINTSFVDSVNIYKNNYPLQYDGKTGGVVELFSTDRQAKKTKGNIEVNLLTGSADVTIPISKSTMLQFAGRTTLGNVSNSQFNTFSPEAEIPSIIKNFNEPIKNIATSPTFNFYDLNVSLQSRIRKHDKLSISFYKSADELTNIYDRRLEDNQNDRLDLLANEEGNWSNIAIGVGYNMHISKTIHWNTQLHSTRYDNEITNSYRVEEAHIAGDGMPGPMNQVSELRAKQKNNLIDNSINSYLSYTKGDHNFQLGLSATQHDIKYKIEENKQDLFEGKKLFYESAIYAGYNGKLTDKLSVNTGVRASYFEFNRGSYLSPRVLANYQLSKIISLKTSYGYYQQVVRQFHYEYRGEPMALWVSAGQNDIPVLKSHNMMVGTTARFDGFTLDVELYQKQMNGMIEYAVTNPGNGSADPNQPRNYQLFKGDGVTRGIDIMLSTGYNNYDTFLSYTLSKSQQRFDAIIMNSYFPTEDDRLHQLKWINTLNTGNFTWGANTIFVSGRRYTDIGTLGPQGNITETESDLRFSRLPAYQRIDLSASFDFKTWKIKSRLSIALFNALNNQNVKYVQSVSTQIEQNQMPVNTVIGSDSNLLGRTLNLSWKIGF